MKKLLLIALMFAGVAVFAAANMGTHRLYIFSPNKLAVASEVELNGGDYKVDGEYAGVRYYFRAKPEGNTVTLKVTPSADGEIRLQISGMKNVPASEYSSIKVDGKELLDEPLTLNYRGTRPSFEVNGTKDKEMTISMTIKAPAEK